MNRCLFRLALGIFVLAALAAAVPAEAASCGGCGALLQKCSDDCLGQGGKGDLSACMMACDNAAAACASDEPVTLRSEDVIAMGLLLQDPGTNAAACHGNVTCPGFPSCASWSGYADCGDPICGTYKWCEDPPFCEAPDICWGPATRTSRERFRVCFNAQSESCVEYQVTNNHLAGCGCDF